MQANPNCPVCDARAWETIGERRYSLSDLPKLNEYVRKRYRVLFEHWAVGQDAVDCKSAMCSSCGFVSNLPRPDDQEIAAKYGFLAKLGQDYGQSESFVVQRGRSRALYSFLRPWLPRVGRLLDFGGGDGRLMRTFAKAGYECTLVDYNESPQPYVRKLGDTIDQIPADLEFHVIVCSHVIEHVADPVGVIRGLTKHLIRRGILFVEVPMEIWRKAPLHVEPVTHVNFFAPSTLKRCVMEAGLSVTYCRLVSSLHPNGTRRAAIRLVAENVQAATDWSTEATTGVVRFLTPGWAERLRYHRVFRPSLWARLRSKASGYSRRHS